MYNRLLLALLLLVVSASLACAGDIIAMPTGNMVPAKQVQLHYIFWNRPQINPPGVRDYLNIGELHVGVCKNLELDYLYVAPQGWDKVAPKSYVNEVNAYFKIFDETPSHPSLIVGATNVFGNDWLPSSQRPNPAGGDNRLSPFAVGAYNAWTPKGAPSVKDPLVRLHLGYGTGWHESTIFGGVQVAFAPQWGVGWFNYQRQPAYLASYMPWKGWELNAGWDKGDPVYHVGYAHQF